MLSTEEFFIFKKELKVNYSTQFIMKCPHWLMVAFNMNMLIGQEILVLKCPLSALMGVPIEWVEFYRENVLRAFPRNKENCP